MFMSILRPVDDDVGTVVVPDKTMIKDENNLNTRGQEKEKDCVCEVVRSNLQLISF